MEQKSHASAIVYDCDSLRSAAERRRYGWTRYMPRLTPILQREQVAEHDRTAFDEIIASRGRINAPQSMLMYAPQISVRASSLNDALRELLSEADFEVAV